MERGPDRVLAVDVARGLALLSMFVAHTAPSPGPLGLLELSEWLTAALFALLMGVGVELGAARRSKTAARAVIGGFVRALALVVLGLLLEVPHHQVDVILVPLGVTLLLTELVVRLPSLAIGGIAAVMWIVGPRLVETLADDRTRLILEDSSWLRVLDVLATGSSYRVTTLVVWACVGVLLGRVLWRQGQPRSMQLSDTLLVLLTAAWLSSAAVLLVPHKAGIVEARPYSGTMAEVALDTALAVAALLASVVASNRMPRPSLNPLAWAGAMTLTLYALHVLGLATYLMTRPANGTDDSWMVLTLLVVAGLTLPVAWRLVVRPGRFRRGPLEGVVGSLSDVVRGTLRPQ